MKTLRDAEWPRPPQYNGLDRPLHPVQKRFIGAIIASNKGWDAPFPLDFALMDSPSLFASGPTSPCNSPEQPKGWGLAPVEVLPPCQMGLPHNP